MCTVTSSRFDWPSQKQSQSHCHVSSNSFYACLSLHVWLHFFRLTFIYACTDLHINIHVNICTYEHDFTPMGRYTQMHVSPHIRTQETYGLLVKEDQLSSEANRSGERDRVQLERQWAGSAAEVHLEMRSVESNMKNVHWKLVGDQVEKIHESQRQTRQTKHF